jgi:hypothetical protein
LLLLLLLCMKLMLMQLLHPRHHLLLLPYSLPWHLLTCRLLMHLLTGGHHTRCHAVLPLPRQANPGLPRRHGHSILMACLTRNSPRGTATRTARGRRLHDTLQHTLNGKG